MEETQSRSYNYWEYWNLCAFILHSLLFQWFTFVWVRSDWEIRLYWL